ncbi:MAG: hypothetical protein HN475_09775, partial [Piscirickettsiaceae bacterium]|nr:hypothetical protein [Piscirickettsiaceae bacterium]
MELEKQSINIVALLNDNLQRNESTYNNKRLHIKVEINNELTVNSDKNILTILIDNVIRNIFIHGDTEANITVCENSLIFENNFKALPNSIEHKKETQGLQIIKQLAEKINVDISTSLTDQQFDLNIFFRPEHKGHCPKRD